MTHNESDNIGLSGSSPQVMPLKFDIFRGFFFRVKIFLLHSNDFPYPLQEGEFTGPWQRALSVYFGSKGEKKHSLLSMPTTSWTAKPSRHSVSLHEQQCPHYPCSSSIIQYRCVLLLPRYFVVETGLDFYCHWTSFLFLCGTSEQFDLESVVELIWVNCPFNNHRWISHVLMYDNSISKAEATFFLVCFYLILYRRNRKISTQSAFSLSIETFEVNSFGKWIVVHIQSVRCHH